MEWTKLLRPETRVQLLLNHRKQEPVKGTKGEIDFEPVCKLFIPWAGGTWLLTECDPDGLAFGLADIGYPELGYVSLDELAELRGPGGMTVEEDKHWTAKMPLSRYAEEARREGCIRA
jgi:hypothetical protein